MKKMILISLALILGACTDARIASQNLSRAAEQFELDRRIVFYNGITGEYMLTITGRCSVDTKQGQLAVTCKTGSNEYKKHYLGLSDNVTYFSEQLKTAKVDAYRYRVIFKPEAILPDIDIKTSQIR